MEQGLRLENSIISSRKTRKGYYKYNMPVEYITPFYELIMDDYIDDIFTIEVSGFKLSKYLEFLSNDNSNSALFKSLEEIENYQSHLFMIFKTMTMYSDRAIGITKSAQEYISIELVRLLFESLMKHGVVHLINGYQDPVNDKNICSSAYPIQTTVEQDLCLVEEVIKYQSDKEEGTNQKTRDVMVKARDTIQKYINKQR